MLAPPPRATVLFLPGPRIGPASPVRHRRTSLIQGISRALPLVIRLALMQRAIEREPALPAHSAAAIGFRGRAIGRSQHERLSRQFDP